MISSQQKKYLNLIDFYKFYKAHDLIFNMIISPKGVGKTYSGIKLVFWLWENYKIASTWVYRYFTELEAGLLEHQGENYIDLKKYSIHKTRINAVVRDRATEEIVCVYQTVNLAKYSKNIQQIELVIFDEFISESDSYLKEEFKKFYLLLSNTFRDKKSIMCIMLGNYHKTDSNPYFAAFRFYMFKFNTDLGLHTYKNRSLYLVKYEDFKEVIDNQIANDLLSDDKQLEQAYKYGKFSFNNNNLILDFKPPFTVPLYNVIWDGKTYYVEKDMGGRLFFFKNGTDEGIKKYTLSILDSLMNSNRLDGLDFLQVWEYGIINKTIFFETPDMRNEILGVIDRMYQLIE